MADVRHRRAGAGEPRAPWHGCRGLPPPRRGMRHAARQGRPRQRRAPQARHHDSSQQSRMRTRPGKRAAKRDVARHRQQGKCIKSCGQCGAPRPSPSCAPRAHPGDVATPLQCRPPDLPCAPGPSACPGHIASLTPARKKITTNKLLASHLLFRTLHRLARHFVDNRRRNLRARAHVSTPCVRMRCLS
jgi:hypothetical protein